MNKYRQVQVTASCLRPVRRQIILPIHARARKELIAPTAVTSIYLISQRSQI